MNAITFVKEITTLSTATALLKVSTLANRLAVIEVEAGTKILKSTDDLAGAKLAFKHINKGMKHAKNGRTLRDAAFSIHAPIQH